MNSISFFISSLLLLASLASIGQQTFSVSGQFYDCGNENKGILKSYPTLLQNKQVIDTLAVSNEGEFSISSLKPGKYSIQFQWIFAVKNSYVFHVYDKDVKDLQICIDSLPNSLYQSERLEDQVKGPNKLRINRSVLVDGKEYMQYIVLYRKKKQFYAKYESPTEEATKELTKEEFDLFERFFTESKNLSLPDRCNETEWYFIAIHFTDLYFTDSSCIWNGFERLKNRVFKEIKE